jgi:hypothetical protein
LAKFAFDFSTEFPASYAKIGFRENFAPKVLGTCIRLVSAVRFNCGQRRVRQRPLERSVDTRSTASANDPKVTLRGSVRGSG